RDSYWQGVRPSEQRTRAGAGSAPQFRPGAGGDAAGGDGLTSSRIRNPSETSNIERRTSNCSAHCALGVRCLVFDVFLGFRVPVSLQIPVGSALMTRNRPPS